MKVTIDTRLEVFHASIGRDRRYEYFRSAKGTHVQFSGQKLSPPPQDPKYHAIKTFRGKVFEP